MNVGICLRVLYLAGLVFRSLSITIFGWKYPFLLGARICKGVFSATSLLDVILT